MDRSPDFASGVPGHIFHFIASKHFSTRNKVLAHSMQIWYKGRPPQTSINESLQFQLGNGGIDLDAGSKSFRLDWGEVRLLGLL